jgi:hypothetical protein
VFAVERTNRSNHRQKRWITILRTLILVLVCASITHAQTAAPPWPGPNAPYDMWMSFEACPVGSAPTVLCLSKSTHGAAGKWSIANMRSDITVTSASQDPFANAPGDRGGSYNGTDTESYLTWTPPSSVNQMTIGFYWHSSNQSNCTGAYRGLEGPHFITYFNNSVGNTWRLSDECASGGGGCMSAGKCAAGPGVGTCGFNTRSVRLSPNYQCIVVKDDTDYYVVTQYIKGAPFAAAIFQCSPGSACRSADLVDTATTGTDSANDKIDSIGFMGSSLTNGATQTYVSKFDDLLVNYTTAPSPTSFLPSADPHPGRASTAAGDGSSRAN